VLLDGDAFAFLEGVSFFWAFWSKHATRHGMGGNARDATRERLTEFRTQLFDSVTEKVNKDSTMAREYSGFMI